MADCPHRVDHRCTSARAAIVLVHGFGGNAEATWGLFPELLKKEPRLQNWDVFSLGYSTSLAFDLAGVWSADPEIITLGGLIQTVTDVAPLDRYGSLAILAHRMGGLLVQRALLSNAALRERVSHLLLFGTPSAGLERASPFQFWKRQVRDTYARALAFGPMPQQIASMYQQAFRAADLMGEEALASELRAMFGHSPTVAPA